MILSSGNRNQARTLRTLLAGSETIQAPGAYDCLSARLVEAAGFPVVYMTGFGTSAAYLGRPDVGLLGMSEMVDNAARIVDAVAIPVIADADTGYGNAINVIRTVQSYERARVAAAHLYHEAGADVLFVEAPENEDEIERIARELRGIPLLFNWAEGGKTPPVRFERLRELGFRVVIFPISTLLTAAHAMTKALEAIRQHGTPMPVLADMTPFKEFVNFLGFPEIRELERRFSER